MSSNTHPADEVHHRDPESGSESHAPGWRVGALGGIPVFIGGGWLVIGLVMVVLFGPQVALALPGLGVLAYAVAAGYAFLLLLSVLLHEAAHAVVARMCGYRVHRIVADLMGGHTAYDAARATPGRSALVAVAGPVANGVVCLLGWLVLPHVRGDVTGLLLGAVAWTNGFVAIFNLLPGLPLDGGFLLDSLVWRLSGRRHLGLLAAGWSGRLVTVAVVVWFLGLPLTRGQIPSLFTLAWAGLVGAFLWMGASQAITTGRLRGRLAALDVQAVTVPVLTMPVRGPLSSIPPIARADAERGVVVAVLDHDGKPVGILDSDAVAAAVAAGHQDATAESCLRAMPPNWVLEMPAATPDLGAAVDALVERRLPLLLLVEPGGAPWGALDGGTVAALAAGRRPR
ncbi:MAG: M50 family metallopeptidase [Micrococcales bacterium]|nr:M50 family metallopeptidase [Micrococcales bacterium]